MQLNLKFQMRISRKINPWDLGSFPTPSPIGIDFGTFIAPSPNNLDLGGF